MTESACRLDDIERSLVEVTIAAHCRLRGWSLHAVNCRSNHLHVVVTAKDRHPDEVRDQLKAWTVRRLKELELERVLDKNHASSARKKWWAERGSKRYLSDEDSLEAAIQYVRDSQGVPR